MILDKIKGMMACKGINMTSLANSLGTSRQNVNNKFHRGSISADDLVRIAKICGCKVIITDEQGLNIEL